MRHAVATGVVPGAVLVAGVGDEDGCAADDEASDCHIWSGGVLAQGADPYDRASGAVGPGTVFDLASLTKVLATLPAVLRLVDSGDIALDDAVEKFLPAFVGPGKDAVTIRHLLSHTSGLPAHRKLYLLEGGPAELLVVAAAEPLVEPAGTGVCYSDLGFILLGEVIAAVFGSSVDRAARELVFEPLGLPGLRFRPLAEWRPRVAATEVPPGASKPTLGLVHDENAATLGGVAGHAGLFGTGPDVATCLRKLWLAPPGGKQGSPLSEAVRAEAFRCQTEGLGGRRGLGWTLRGDRWDHLSGGWTESAAGHTGFTGTSVALDPVNGRWAVLLTNAVRLGREKNGIVALRREVHSALAADS